MDINLTVDEAAELLGISPGTLRNWRCVDRGPISYLNGKRIYYRRSDVTDWLDRQFEATKRGGNL